jgi:REP element-mobilizing transposase RayT
MTSPSPLLYNTYYHIYNRGNNRENIFIQERNFHHFFNLYGKYIEPVTETFAYCLLRNHFHLLVKIKSEEEITETRNAEKPLEADYPSKQFSDFFNAYSKAINAAYGRTGSLFQHPFGRVMVTSDRQFWNVIAYIHQNPQKHKFVDDFRDWKWSSYGVMLSEKPTKLNRSGVLDWFGGRDRYLELHKEWVTEAQSQWFAEGDLD